MLAEENELQLEEGELIRDIIQVDEGWWQGTSEDGTRSGLFPGKFFFLKKKRERKRYIAIFISLLLTNKLHFIANFVELINPEEISNKNNDYNVTDVVTNHLHYSIPLLILYVSL